MSPKHRALPHAQSAQQQSHSARQLAPIQPRSATEVANHQLPARVSRRALPLLSCVVMAGLSAVLVVAPQPVAYADSFQQGELAGQQFVADGQAASATRDGYGITALPKAVPAASSTKSPAKTSSSSGSVAAPAVSAPAVGTPDPGTAQAIAQGILQQRGLGDDQYACLVALWNRESHWNVYAHSRTGAYGIPQALPGSKMASAGADWASNPTTQILWGLGYITGRYGTPCGAWGHSQSTGWY